MSTLSLANQQLHMFTETVPYFLVADAQTQLASAVEKERAASEKVLDSTTRLKALESQVAGLRQEKSRLSAQLEMERAKAEVLEESKMK